MNKVLFSILSLVITTSAHAIGTRGGGTPIETGFRLKVFALIREAQHMPAPQKALLKFNPDQLIAIVGQPNAFKALCESGSTLAKLQKLNKMAFVFGDEPGVVSLDCTKYSEADWKLMFQSDADEDESFFIHEAMRIAGVPDNDYFASSSFATAKRVSPDYENKRLANAMFYLLSNHANPQSRCSVKIDSTDWDQPVTKIYFFAGAGAQVFDHVYLSRFYISTDVRVALIKPIHPVLPIPSLTNNRQVADREAKAIEQDARTIQDFRKRIYFQAQKLGCVR